MRLEREIRTYRSRLPELVQHAGRYVLIQGDSVIDHFASYADAIRYGYRRFGLEPFLVKQIQVHERVHFLPPGIIPLASHHP